MSLFKKRPQLARLEYVSPPSTEVVHEYAEVDLSASERAAKRRRIEDYANEYLKGRDVFISSASLRGPFGNGWKNPWKRKTSGEQAAGTHVGHVSTKQTFAKQYTNNREIETSKVVVADRSLDVMENAALETEARPLSRTGSDYCHDWLRKQKVRQYTPDLDDEFDTDIRDGVHTTPSKHLPQRRTGALARYQRSVRPEVVPAWTANHPENHINHSDLPEQYTRFNSLQVDVGSSAVKRSVSEQPVRGPYRGTVGTRGAVAVDTALTKVSLIRDDRPQRRNGASPHAKMLQGNYVIDSPGFTFRRVADGKRPISRGSNRSKPSTTEPDKEGMDARPWDSVANAGTIEEQAPDLDDDYQSEEEGCTTIYNNDEGKWPCPVPVCPKRPKPYASRSGIRGHLKNKHNIQYIRTDTTRVVAPPKQKKTRSVDTDDEPGREPANMSQVIGTETAAQEAIRVAPAKPQLPDVSGQERTGQASTVVEEPISLGHGQSPASMATVVDVIPAAAEAVRSAVQPEPESEPKLGKSLPEDSAVAPPAGDEKQSARDVDIDGVESHKSVGSSKTHLSAPRNKSATDPPNRQDSRAYSTFTFNLEMSTQAALLQAHQAFQETQSPEKASVQVDDQQEGQDDADADSHKPDAQKPVASASAATPFRRPGLPSFFNLAPESITRAMPASTQDLMNAAADLTFSTAKKPATKKRISFADWTQAKPSQAIGSMKPVEWSPFVETPVPAKSAAAGRSYHSQSEEATPIKTVPPKPFLSFSKTSSGGGPMPTIPQRFAQPRSSTLGNRSTPSAPSELPIPSYQEAQGYDSLEIENALDDAVSFLSTWDVDKEIQRNSMRKKSGNSRLKAA